MLVFQGKENVKKEMFKEVKSGFKYFQQLEKIAHLGNFK